MDVMFRDAAQGALSRLTYVPAQRTIPGTVPTQSIGVPRPSGSDLGMAIFTPRNNNAPELHELEQVMTNLFREISTILTQAASDQQDVQAATGRSRGAVEYKFANISAVLADLGLPHVPGYQPYANYQDALRAEVERFFAETKLLHTSWPMIWPPPSITSAAVPLPCITQTMDKESEVACACAVQKSPPRERLAGRAEHSDCLIEVTRMRTS